MQFGQGDTSYRAAGGQEGIERLVADFYRFMDELPEAKRIRDMHDDDLSVVSDKLARFLCGWLGGPRLFFEKYGPISIPGVHANLDINEAARDAWLLCMKKAIALQDYSPEFSEYLIVQLGVPAERIRMVCQSRR